MILDLYRDDIGKFAGCHNIYPVEVKSANDYTTVSMDKFTRKFAANVAHPVVLHPGDAKFDEKILKRPLYMAMMIPEFTA